jgi:nucleoside-diphosphate-sugar epimerase
MRILVTGGSGLVGRRVVALLAAEHEVVNFDLRPPSEQHGAYVQGDILDGTALRRALHGADAVVHAAAIPGPSFGTPEEIVMTNVGGTRAAALAANEKGVPRFVFISSEAVLGFVFSGRRTKPRYFPIDEAHPASPSEPYGASKLAAERALDLAARGGLTVVCLRPPWVWVPEEYARCRELTKSPDEWWDGLWAYMHGDDLARAVGLAVTRDVPAGFHAVYVAAPDNGTVLPTRELLARHYPDVPIRDGLGEFASLISSEGARKLLGAKPAMTWREFLR